MKHSFYDILKIQSMTEANFSQSKALYKLMDKHYVDKAINVYIVIKPGTWSKPQCSIYMSPYSSQESECAYCQHIYRNMVKPAFYMNTISLPLK